MEFFDIHTHIAPGIDDGAKDSQVAIKMLEKMHISGVNNIILTPHYNERMHLTHCVAEIMDTVHMMAKTVSNSLNIFSGNEVYYSSNTLNRLSDGSIATLANSKYVLIEFSPAVVFEDLIYCVNEVLMYGYWPVLAHAERYNCLYGKDSAERLVTSGVHLQINAESIMSGNFRTTRFIKRLISNNLISFIASDCHNLSSRPPNLTECAEVLHKKFNSDTVARLLCKNPQCIIENKRITF